VVKPENRSKGEKYFDKLFDDLFGKKKETKDGVDWEARKKRNAAKPDKKEDIIEPAPVKPKKKKSTT